LCEHKKIQQQRQKLNYFHRHLTNRTGIMSPWTKTGVNIKSISQVLVWHQLNPLQ